MRHLFFLCMAFVWMTTTTLAQISINSDNSAPDNSAMLDVKSTTKGLLIPRMTRAQRDAITDPAPSLMIFQTNSVPGFYYNSGTSVSPNWILAGAGGGEVYAQVFTVALAGGDYTSINSALAACTAPSPSNMYLIRVMPGIYNDSPVNCLDYVDLKGSGKNSCVINGHVICASNMQLEGFRINDGIECNGVSPLIINNFITKLPDISTANTGIILQSWSQAWIVDNDITGCLYYGILCIGIDCKPWIIGNRIIMNGSPDIEGAGIWIIDGSPNISNNLIEWNHWIGINVSSSSLYDPVAMPKPVITDNIIRMNQYLPKPDGKGIKISGNAEPRILSNDISGSVAGISIEDFSQPVITGNQIHDNCGQGIYCTSQGISKTISISFNNLQKNGDPGVISGNLAGLYISESNPLVTHNVFIDNLSGIADIDYSACGLVLPVISSNVYDLIIRKAVPPVAGGSYNTDSGGNPIGP